MRTALLKKKKKKKGDGDEKDANKNTKTVTLCKQDYGEMIRYMFKLMVGGSNGKRMKIIKKMMSGKTGHPQLKVFMRLAEEEFGASEYRLSLWLPLTLEQKLDMILNQRMEEEMELMIFLVEEEMEVHKSLKNNGKIEVMLEKAFDSQIFEKYMLVTRL